MDGRWCTISPSSLASSTRGLAARIPFLWNRDHLCRLGERNLHTTIQEHRFVFQRNTAVHHRAVPISLNVHLEALMWFTPVHLHFGTSKTLPVEITQSSHC